MTAEVDETLDRFVEGLFRLMLEHHQRQVIEVEITLPQVQAMRLLRSAPVSTNGLAGALGISPPAVTQLTDRLFRKHLIERRSDEADRRCVLVALTEKGRRVVDRLRQRRNEVFGEALARLSDDDRAEVIRALGKVASVLDTADAGQPVALRRVVRHPRPDRGRQTAVEPLEASKITGHPTMGSHRRRMKIEWD